MNRAYGNARWILQVYISGAGMDGLGMINDWIGNDTRV